MAADVVADTGAAAAPMASLSICTVSYQSAPYLDLNVRLSRELNPGHRLAWIVAENTPEHGPRFGAPDGDTIVIEGAPPEPRHRRASSYQHAAALHGTLALAQTRYVLVLDPDFFIVRPAWARDVVEHMQRRELALFGVPWHPKWHWKYRYFPCSHCLFIDASRIDLSALDFRPSDREASAPAARPGVLRRALKACTPPAARRILMNLAERGGIGITLDTAYRLYEAFASRRDVRVECAQPVYCIETDYPVSDVRWLSRLLDWLLPDPLSYAPKRRGSYVRSGMDEVGLGIVRELGWEEFVWRGAPFGFHVRGQQRPGLSPNADVARVRQLLEALRGRTISG